MKTIWIFALTVGVVSAGSLGYHYKVPHTSYGLPSYQHGDDSNQFSSAYASSGSGSIYKGYPEYSTSGYTGNINSESAFGSGLTGGVLNGDYSGGYGSEYSSGLSSGLHSDLGSSLSTGLGSGFSTGLGSSLSSDLSSDLGSSYYLNSGSGSTGYTVKPIYQYGGSHGLGGYQSQYQSSEYQTSALEKYKNYYQVRQQPTQVFKHFYVHAAPEEPESQKPRTPIVLPPAQKHYKIIFVKTPSESRTPQVVPVPQVQNEEKTIVYVLVKKPEETQDVIVPQVEQKPPSKPEVYFIKYGNKEDSQAVINNIVKDYNKGESVSLVNTGVADGLGSGPGVDVNSGLGGTYGGSTLSDSYDSSSFGSSYDNSGFSGAYDGSGLNNFASSGLSGVLGTTNYQIPVNSEASASASSFGNQAYGINASPATHTLSLASAESGASESQVANGISTPITISSTASTISYDDANAISTSQGVPHETYGPPKFRVD